MQTNQNINLLWTCTLSYVDLIKLIPINSTWQQQGPPYCDIFLPLLSSSDKCMDNLERLMKMSITATHQRCQCQFFERRSWRSWWKGKLWQFSSILQRLKYNGFSYGCTKVINVVGASPKTNIHDSIITNWEDWCCHYDNDNPIEDSYVHLDPNWIHDGDHSSLYNQSATSRIKNWCSPNL